MKQVRFDSIFIFFLSLIILNACASGSSNQNNNSNNNQNNQNNLLPECGNHRVDADEECDDGNTLDGDGCSAICRREPLYPGFVQVVNGRILYREEPFIILGAAFLPEGVLEQDALSSGFNVLLNSNIGLQMIWVPYGASVADFIAPYVDNPAVLGWVGPDEPLWNGITVETLVEEFTNPVHNADPWGRPILLNHAPRGSATEPSNFDLLLPYLSLSNIVSMDIYPIPEGNGHSILPEHPGLSAVGEYTRILTDLSARAGGHNAVVMILEGAGMGHIPSERWEMREHWLQDDAINFDRVHFVQAADIDADGFAELVVGYTNNTGTGYLAAYDFQDRPFGGRVWETTVPTQLALDHVWRSTVGDFDGDGRQDLLLVVDLSEQEQQLWIVPMQPGEFGTPFMAYTNYQPEVVWSVAHFWLSGDFDQDGCDDLLFSYNYPDPNHQVWYMVPSSCTGFRDGMNSQLGAMRWFDAPKTVLDLSRVCAATLVQSTGSDRPAVLLVGQGTNGRLEILRMNIQNNALDAPQTLLHDVNGTLDPNGVRLFSAGSFRGQTNAQFVLVQQEGSSIRLLAADTSAVLNSESLLETWLSTEGELTPRDRTLGGCSGDFDGDGLPDVVLPVRSPDNHLQLDVAFSTGRFFGARDPLPEELRFMAFDALIRGAQGVIFWGQEFVDASHVSWSRLQNTVSELSKLRSIMQGEILYRHVHSGFAEWWVRTPEAIVAFVANETRTDGGVFHSNYNPGANPQTSVQRWNRETFITDTMLSPNLPFVDPQSFRAYEIRIYQFK